MISEMGLEMIVNDLSKNKTLKSINVSLLWDDCDFESWVLDRVR